MDYLISVIIPVYNVENYIARCLNSVINQTYQNLEIILVDDGSTDESGMICHEYAEKDNRIKVIHKENGGVSSARNVGLDNAKGDYIGFVDPDDYINECMYETLMREMNSGDYNVVECNYLWDHEDGSRKERNGINKVYIAYHDILRDLFKTDISHGIWNKLYKKGVVNGVRFNSKFKVAEDSLFLYECAKNMKLKCIDKPLYYYFQRTTSVLNRPFHEGMLDRLTVCDMIKSECISEELKAAFNSYYLPSLVYVSKQVFVSENLGERKEELMKKIRENRKEIWKFKPYKTNNWIKDISKKDKLYVFFIWACPWFIRGIYQNYIKIRTGTHR